MPSARVGRGSRRFLRMSCGDRDLDQRCRFSDTPTFIRPVDILPEGDRLVNGDARCAKGYQGSLSCHTGEHRFAFASICGETPSLP
jgi:hypothetical protein